MFPRVPSTDAPDGVAVSVEAPSDRERQLLLWLLNLSHAVDHFQNQIVTAVYPVIAAEMGMGPTQLGVFTAIRNIFAGWTQLGYGFVTPFVQRPRLLGVGNLVVALGTFFTGLAGSFGTLLMARCFTATGSSAQHPVGASLLTSYFPKSRGTILALNNSIASIGNLMAPIAVGALILWVDWRQIFLPVAIISLCIGMAYFWFRDRIRDSSGQPTSRRGKLVYSAGSYLRVLRNRNMVLIALVMMVGGAGRGVVTPTYLPLHLNLDLDLETSLAIFSLAVLQVGGIAGSLGMGWLSDRVSRKKVIQASQLLSVVATGWLAWQGPYLPILTLSLLVYGAFTQARGVLTQALVADSVGEADRDAAFSVYFFLSFVSTPFWAVLTGYLMETYSFSWAFSLLGLTYLLGAFFMLFVQENRQAARAA